MSKSKNVRIIVTDDDGTLLDTVTVTRDEFRRAQEQGAAAAALLDSLAIGDDS